MKHSNTLNVFFSTTVISMNETPVTLTSVQLHEAAIGFESVSSRLRTLFYVITFVQILAGTLSAALHGNSEILKFIDGDHSWEGILLGIISQLSASTLTFLSIQGAMTECKTSYEIATEYKLTRRPIPVRMLKMMISARTLCFRHPMRRIPVANDVIKAKLDTLANPTKYQLAPARKAPPRQNV